ncbi:hypothetical protein GCM10007301_37680 [Azorhizobium oxalatiphilum]|uniref:Type II toxin-antitoxin system RelE/ParE family toxin n=1 Tax=Azorhizobium oxalatiphilum TaxID=980631 RepID=A0A917FFF1_9HYPH|nr:type II toxin-antitoxin system RelE/ParE family toxin [Azorhizobium oxalatiphilum]GGF74325.1 hypothetical protein GCM10007301_37680 [Azorhizobium oxalatiphilum]
MARTVTFRPAALTDLDAIEDYIARDRPERAAAFVDGIIARCGQLGAQPEMGRARDDLRPGLRLLPLDRRVVVVYRLTPGPVEIIRIFYGGRDFAALIAGEP